MSRRARTPAVAGTFYPSEPGALRTAVVDLLADAGGPLPGVRGVVAPHAGYAFSGTVAARAFAALPFVADPTVWLLGPAHHLPVHGCAVPSAAALATPLGTIEVAQDVVAALLATVPDSRVWNEAHRAEHCLEVHLPFLTVRFGPCRVVPVLVGEAASEPLAAYLAPLLAADPQALVVASSDLSHWHTDTVARRRDQLYLAAIERGDLAAIRAGEACGRAAIAVLALVAQELGWQPTVLSYLNSGAVTGEYGSVVGYGAVAYAEA